MSDSQISILDGSTFAVSARDGDITDGNDGLYHRDTRHLSRWQLRLDGRALVPLVGEVTEYDSAVFYLIEPLGAVYDAPRLSVTRHRHLGRGMRETITVGNHTACDRTVTLTLRFEADFADIFQIRGGTSKSPTDRQQLCGDAVTLRYERQGFRRCTRIHAPGAVLTPESATFTVTVAAGERWSVPIEVTPWTGEPSPQPTTERGPQMAAELPEWLAAMPELDTEWEPLRRAYRRSVIDLAALRFYPDVTPRASLPAGGLPWYMALLGRDCLIAAYQALPFVPELCRTTLRALAARQATGFDDWRDAEPGKILHELRHGELVHLRQRPHSPYYGSCDSTPLFLIVLDEYERWTGDTATIVELEPAARAALRWVEQYGDLDGDGYLEYRTRNPEHGMANHCWKDSDSSIVYPDGRLAPLPRATCEIQGYAYDARVRTARLARTIWHDPGLADRLEADAAGLRTAFNRDFWLEQEGWYALALDGDKRPVPTLTSNIGHLLWSGIVPADRAAGVAGHLLGDRMFSGWGVRTLATGQPAFNPAQYHNGSVWPHDNALIAAGLARYGHRAEVARIAEGMMAAAPHFAYRLPELFAGEAREDTVVPVPYPHAGSPQAWATGATLLLIRAVLGMEPGEHEPVTDPQLPAGVHRLALRGVPGRWGRADTG